MTACAAPKHMGAMVAIAAVLSFGLGAATEACTPKDRDALVPAIAPSVRAGCIFLRALFKDGTANDICVTAEELAPLVPQILADREERGKVESVDGPIVAFAIKEGPRIVPKRRCAVWMSVEVSSDAGAKADAAR